MQSDRRVKLTCYWAYRSLQEWFCCIIINYILICTVDTRSFLFWCSGWCCLWWPQCACSSVPTTFPAASARCFSPPPWATSSAPTSPSSSARSCRCAAPTTRCPPASSCRTPSSWSLTQALAGPGGRPRSFTTSSCCCSWQGWLLLSTTTTTRWTGPTQAGSWWGCAWWRSAAGICRVRTWCSASWGTTSFPIRVTTRTGPTSPASAV